MALIVGVFDHENPCDLCSSASLQDLHFSLPIECVANDFHPRSRGYFSASKPDSLHNPTQNQSIANFLSLKSLPDLDQYRRI